ncbi:MAG: ribosome modulation factor [Cellvibrionales bacterium]|jgi:ribosome modulation factor|nr:ribosome modulation factor [Cellvibrionales bacterium]
MKTQKRDTQIRAYHHGYQAGVKGKSLSACPFETFGSEKRYQWTSGWRDGRRDQWSGNTAIGGLHKIAL